MGRGKHMSVSCAAMCRQYDALFPLAIHLKGRSATKLSERVLLLADNR